MVLAPKRKKAANRPASGGNGPEDEQPIPIGLTPEERANLELLIVDDDHTLVETCSTVLRQEGYQVTTCERGTDALELLRHRNFDIALFDLHMPQITGLELLTQALEHNPSLVAAVITGDPTIETSIEALRIGAFDYLPKPFSATHLKILVGRAAHVAMVAEESDVHVQEAPRSAPESAFTLIGESPSFTGMLDLAKRVARTDASVFISGESGTGKELIAQYIHQNSRRVSRPFIPVNCAALPETLLESEMFGHRKGAFTGAVEDKPGLLETANGGTFFLDELTEMSPQIQAKLLRVIQDGVVRRVGSTDTDAVVAVRFIAATNRDPAEAVKEGVLRKDLFYRLRVVPIQIPPLRERKSDIPLLANHFLERFWKRHRDPSEERPVLSDAAIESLKARQWAGNVRELENVIEHAVVLAEPGGEIGSDEVLLRDVTGPEVGMGAGSSGMASDHFIGEKYHEARDRLIEDFEVRYLKWVVDQADGNMSEAARVAGVDRTTLYRLMEKHDLSIRKKVSGNES